MTSTSTEQAIKSALSAARLSTFEAEVKPPTPILSGALDLYSWNAQVSAALLSPLHICEVVVRNAVSDALTAVYGPRWPWENVFELSLPNNANGFNPRSELIRARRNQPSTGKVIAELKMVFWQKMFTGRFDSRVWNNQLRIVMPNLTPAKSIQELRRLIYTDMEQLRILRNRIAHHEPILKRSLTDDFKKMQKLIAFRCQDASIWMAQNQHAVRLIELKPF